MDRTTATSASAPTAGMARAYSGWCEPRHWLQRVLGFYDDFIVERREHVRARLEYEAQRRAMQAVPSVDLSDR